MSLWSIKLISLFLQLSELLLPTRRESLSVRQTRHTPPKGASCRIQIPTPSFLCSARLCHMHILPSRPETTRQVDKILVSPGQEEKINMRGFILFVRAHTLMNMLICLRLYLMHVLTCRHTSFNLFLKKRRVQQIELVQKQPLSLFA